MTVERTLAAVDEVIRLLAESDRPAAAVVAGALRRWQAGETLESAVGLPTDWRQRKRITDRDRALVALVNLIPNGDARGIARQIIAGLPGCACQPRRPDGATGYIHDLARLGLDLSERHLRRVITELRGHQAGCNGHDDRPGSAKRRNDGNEETDRD